MFPGGREEWPAAPASPPGRGARAERKPSAWIQRRRDPHFFLGGGGGGGGGFLAVEGLGETQFLNCVRPPEDRLGGGFCSFAMIDEEPAQAGAPTPTQESQRLRRR